MLSFACRTSAGAIIAVAASCGSLAAQTNPATAIVPFGEFVAGLGPTHAAAGTPAASAVQEIRQHLLRQYGGVQVGHSYMLGDQVFDCVPIDQQPGIRVPGLKQVAAPPPGAPGPASPRSSVGGPRAAAQLGSVRRDAFGNTQHCDAGAIPMRRVTLEEVGKFGSLRKFFEKGPDGAGRPEVEQRAGPIPPSFGGHSYAHEYQNINNYGGYSYLAVYRPYVHPSIGEIFSLSQQWYVGGSGSALQTAEVGIQNFPTKYGSENSALFIYWTANDYLTTGCYNLDCAAFVQTNSNWHLGAGFANYSTPGGAQWELGLGFYLYQGNWWLAAGNDWVGYYPGSIYRGGQLSSFAQEIDFGGETVGSRHWPKMGSGQYASAGVRWAAYHRHIVYRDSPEQRLLPDSRPVATLAQLPDRLVARVGRHDLAVLFHLRRTGRLQLLTVAGG